MTNHVFLRALARSISCKKRSFGFHPQDDNLLYNGILQTCHCDECSEEAIQEKDTSGSALNMTNKRQKAAFTLAEVLITLGIIGIVAAMTLPMLIAKYQKLVATTQLKRIYSILANAELMAIKDYGDRKYWDYPISSQDPETGQIISPITQPEFFKKYYEPYIRASGVRQKDHFLDGYKVHNFNGQDAGYDNNSIDRGAIFRLSDNTCISVWSNNQFVVFTADLNCEKRPNIIGHDVFDIATVRDTGRGTYKLEPPLPLGKDETRENAIRNCKRASFVGGFPNRCFTLFVYDGWQFKDDYPWK